MTTSTAVIVQSNLPSQIVALSESTVALVAQLTADANALLGKDAVTDAAGLAAGNALYQRIKSFKEGIAAERMEKTRPIDAFKKLIMEAERSATKPLEDAQSALGQVLFSVETKLKLERAEAERKARAEAERVAAELRREQEAKYQAECARHRAEKEAAEKEAAEQRALFGDDAAPTVVAPPPPAPVAPVMPVMAATVALPEVPKSAVQKTVRHRLAITDRQALIDAACKTGGKLYGRQVLIVDEAAIEALLKAAVDVPGAKMEAYETIGAARGRS